MKYRGKILYHGTCASEDFEHEDYGTPTGPAWFSDGIEVAEYFKSWGSGPRPRILIYRVVRQPNLFKFRNMKALAELICLDEEDYVSEENLENYEPGYFVEKICAIGYDGWIIPDNYPEGADIMICEPERFLELVK
jgi:hypothetical protein